jgi:hypothetical protein
MVDHRQARFAVPYDGRDVIEMGLEWLRHMN